MRAADLVVTGTVVTVDQLQPTAEAMAVSDGRISAVGDRSGIERWIGADTEVLDTGAGCVMPGFVEAHGHPLMEAIVLSDRMVDIQPVTIRNADDVVDAVRRELAKRGAQGAYLNGWDPLRQNGLPDPTLAWLNHLAPETPLVIVHNYGHKAYFNSAAAGRAGLTRDTPDPKGASYGRDADGDLDGTAEEIQAVFSLLGGAIQPSDYPAMLRAEMARLNRGGLTTCSDGVRPGVPAGGRADAQRPHRAAAALRDLQRPDEHRPDARQRRRHAPPNRDQDLGRRLTMDRQHRPVLSGRGHRRHPHHRCHSGIVRVRQLHP